MVYGMGMVFAILAMLWGVIAIFQQIDRRVLAKEEEKARLAELAAAPPSDPLPPELMAAILVALHRYRQEDAGLAPAYTCLPAREVKQGQARWVAVGRAYQLRSNIVPRRRNG